MLPHHGLYWSLMWTIVFEYNPPGVYLFETQLALMLRLVTRSITLLTAYSSLIISSQVCDHHAMIAWRCMSVISAGRCRPAVPLIDTWLYGRDPAVTHIDPAVTSIDPAVRSQG
ncbi:uncharacterized protein METZ01_LOCUS513880 [marine metagenome]|uniref:Uncharacterized protein n=1 Tax=marine metagenome TaxID=408172 RepID=A0A383EVU2_9ZZZZ